MRHFMEQFGPALQWPWSKLTDVPELTDELLDRLVEQSDEQAAGESIRELEALRDDCLVAVIQALRAAVAAPASAPARRSSTTNACWRTAPNAPPIDACAGQAGSSTTTGIDAVGLRLVLGELRGEFLLRGPQPLTLLALGDAGGDRDRSGCRPRPWCPGWRPGCGTSRGWSGAPALEAKMTYLSPSRRYTSGFTRSVPDFAPLWCRSNRVAPSNIPPTTPSLVRNSSITLRFQSSRSLTDRSPSTSGDLRMFGG